MLPKRTLTQVFNFEKTCLSTNLSWFAACHIDFASQVPAVYGMTRLIDFDDIEPRPDPRDVPTATWLTTGGDAGSDT